MKRLSLIAPILLAGCGQPVDCKSLRLQEELLSHRLETNHLRRSIGDYVDIVEEQQQIDELTLIRPQFKEECPNEYSKQIHDEYLASKAKLDKALGR